MSVLRYHSSIKEWPENERPREKLWNKGPASLSEAELLAILLRTGNKGATAVDIARKILSRTNSLREVAKMSVADLVELGVGRDRATAIVAAFELHRRLPADDQGPVVVIRSPEDVANMVVPQLRDLQHEEFWVMLLNTANRVMRSVKVTSGTLTSSLVDPRECFHLAVKEKAASVIVVHNHPSGNGEPSQEDIAITRQLVDAGRVLGIPVHDHIIVAGGSYTSFAERGLL